MSRDHLVYMQILLEFCVFINLGEIRVCDSNFVTSIFY